MNSSIAPYKLRHPFPECGHPLLEVSHVIVESPDPNVHPVPIVDPRMIFASFVIGEVVDQTGFEPVTS